MLEVGDGRPETQTADRQTNRQTDGSSKKLKFKAATHLEVSVCVCVCVRLDAKQCRGGDGTVYLHEDERGHDAHSISHQLT